MQFRPNLPMVHVLFYHKRSKTGGTLKGSGHQFVVVEIDLHPKTLGVSHVIESEFGAVLRSLA